MNAESLRVHFSTFGIEIKIGNSATFFCTSLGSLRHMKAGPGAIKSRTDVGYGLDHRLQSAGIFLSAVITRPALAASQPTVLFLQEFFPWGVKRSERDTKHFRMVPRLKALEAIPLLSPRRHDATHVSTGIRLHGEVLNHRDSFALRKLSFTP